jgi:hypothetical protein
MDEIRVTLGSIERQLYYVQYESGRECLRPGQQCSLLQLVVFLICMCGALSTRGDLVLEMRKIRGSRVLFLGPTLSLLSGNQMMVTATLCSDGFTNRMRD